MDLRQAAYVVAVVDQGTFTAAAASIPVSQPALSQAIAALERELGAPLFHRIGRQVQLTSAGEAFLEPARRMLRDAELARRAVGEAADLATGHLDLVALPTLVADPLVPLVGAFRRAHPGVVVRITEPEDADAVAGAVRDGRAELGLGDRRPTDAHRDALLDADLLGRQAIYAVLPPDADLPPSGRLTIARLAAHPLITTPPDTSTGRLLAEALRSDERGTEPTIGVVTDHREAIVPLVLAGAGAAILPEPLARDAARRGAVVAPLSPPLAREVVLVHRRGALSPAARAFRDLATTSAGR